MSAVSPKAPRSPAQRKAAVAAVLAALQRHASKKVRDDLVRYGLPTEKAVGVRMRDIQLLAKQLGRDQELAEAIWEADVYEARLLVAYIGEPARLTPALMDRWCRDFDNWGVVDTLCFSLFDRTPHAWKLVPKWAGKRDEFVKRAGFVLLACLAGHDQAAADKAFLKHLPLIERGAEDERNFVKKGVSWALRMIGRRNAALNAAAVDVARRLAAAEAPAPRWIGRTALKELTSATVLRRIAR